MPLYNKKSRRFIEFEIVIGDTEFDETVTKAFVDVNAIESFYETIDDHVIIEMETGSGFKVTNSIEFVLSIFDD